MAQTTQTSGSTQAVATASGEKEIIVRSLLMQFYGFNVMMPNTAVAEVVAYEAPRVIEQAPVWLKGFITWRGKSVPVVSMESLLGGTEGAPASQARLIIFNTLGDGKAITFIAMIAQGIPRLLALKDENLHYVPGEHKQETGVLHAC